MATVNLGNIKLNWKGAYNSSTAYIVDDVVSYNGSSYVCIQASTNNLPTNTTYWNQMSSAGTDLSSTLTTQGDIVYRDGSGLARLGAGTNGQALITGGAGANPSWGTISSDFVRLNQTSISSGTTNVDIDNVFNQSGYDHFKIIMRGLTPVSDGPALYMRYLNNSGSVISASNYSWGVTGQEYSSGGTNDGQLGHDHNASSVKVVGHGGGVWNNTDNRGTGGIMMHVFNAQDASRTHATWTYGYRRQTGDNGFNMTGSFDLNQNDVVRGFRLYFSSGNFASGIISTYGIK